VLHLPSETVPELPGLQQARDPPTAGWYSCREPPASDAPPLEGTLAERTKFSHPGDARDPRPDGSSESSDVGKLSGKISVVRDKQLMFGPLRIEPSKNADPEDEAGWT
jgi:hypothetical protein